MILLSGDSRWAVVGVADAGGNAADGLHRRVGDGDAIRSEAERLDEVGWRADAARDDQRDILRSPAIEKTSSTGQRRNRRHGDVVSKDQRSGPCSAASTIEDDVVGTSFEGEIDVLLDVLGGQS